MDSDFFLILGILIALFAIPAAIAAFAERRGPRSAILYLAAGGAMFFGAAYSRPEGIVLSEIPVEFYTVLARFIN